MTKSVNWKSTIHACYRGNFTQATIVNLSPLFFVIFQNKFSLTYTMLAAIITSNFVTQMLTDLVAVKYVDKIGYRLSALLAHALAVMGLILIAILPQILPVPFVGIIIGTIISAIGGGLCEVILSPIVDGIPGDAKAGSMSLLHAFYCWGQLTVVLLTTIILSFIGDDLWFVLPLMWALIPLYNFCTFLKVPLHQTLEHHEKTPFKDLFKSKIFILLLLIMICAGASELGICQWSSLYFEKALGVPKVMGDILGPCLFALTMGIGRTVFGLYSHKINLFNALIISSVLCVLCYIGTALFSVPILALISCAFCGLSVALMWPGAISTGSALFPKGGAALFGIMAVTGDIGCSIGPSFLGAVSDFVKENVNLENMNPDSFGLKIGMLCGSIFPLILLFCVIALKKHIKSQNLKV